MDGKWKKYDVIKGYGIDIIHFQQQMTRKLVIKPHNTQVEGTPQENLKTKDKQECKKKICSQTNGVKPRRKNPMEIEAKSICKK